MKTEELNDTWNELGRPSASELRIKINEVLAAYGGKESEIPLDNKYWKMLNVYRILESRSR